MYLLSVTSPLAKPDIRSQQRQISSSQVTARKRRNLSMKKYVLNKDKNPKEHDIAAQAYNTHKATSHGETVCRGCSWRSTLTTFTPWIIKAGTSKDLKEAEYD